MNLLRIFIPHLLRCSRLLVAHLLFRFAQWFGCLLRMSCWLHADVGLGYGIHLLQLVEQLTPVAETRLVLRELVCQSFVISEAFAAGPLWFASCSGRALRL